ncbi:hypothetical protein LXL04_024162 [Taraxacum kok-saghyz]
MDSNLIVRWIRNEKVVCNRLFDLQKLLNQTRSHVTCIYYRSMKLQVYVKAKECSKKVSVEEFAILLAKHFTSQYSLKHERGCLLLKSLHHGGAHLGSLKKYLDVKKVLVDSFFGPPKQGVYSPSIQATLYDMAKVVLARFPDVSSILLKMPNIHFLPVNLSSKTNPVIVKFEDHVYLPTDEPHGSIEASLSRIRSKI